MKFCISALVLALLPFVALAKSETYKLNTADSMAKWEGKKVLGAHQGELRFKSGELSLEKGKLVGGTFDIDMTTLKNTDIADADSNTKLVNHLKSDDFFSVDKNPVATLKITKVEKKSGKTMITGDLMIKGKSNPVTFPAEVKLDKKSLKAKGEISVDRTAYDIRFRSAKFFENLGDKVIKDTFTVSVDITASK